MRVLTAVSILALALTSQVAQAQQRPGAKAAPKATAKVLSPEESAAMADANRKKAEASERARDERLRKATSGICIGC
jgi:flagellar motility protein MotE (MotC chaperone)